MSSVDHQKSFIDVELRARDGEQLVQNVKIYAFSILPEILVWGSRHFSLATSAKGVPVYVESFAVIIAPIPGVTGNGLQP
jgi:hypothetical protein